MNIKCLFGFHEYEVIGHLYNRHVPVTISIYDQCTKCSKTRNVRYSHLTMIAYQHSQTMRYFNRHNKQIIKLLKEQQ